jgi:hypothetical protein
MKIVSKRLSSFFSLGFVELFITGFITLAISDGKRIIGNISLIAGLIAASCLIAAGLLIFLRNWILKSAPRHARAEQILSSAWGQIAPAFIPPLLTAGIFIKGMSSSLLIQVSPALFCLWLIGAELLYLFSPEPANSMPGSPAPKSRAEGLFSLLTTGFLYLALALRTPISGVLNGLPWNTPWEFDLTLFAIPVIFILNRRFFARKPVLFLILFILVGRAFFALSMPVVGLEIQLSQGEEGYHQQRWTRSYASILDPGLTELMREPYQSPREFPIEWINSEAISLENFWLNLDFTGYFRLEQGETLVLLANGVAQGSAEIVNLQTSQRQPVLITPIGSKPKLRGSENKPGEYQLHGLLMFKHYDQQQFSPVIVGSDGSIKSALETGRIWRSANGLGMSPNMLRFLAFFDGGILLLLVAILLFGILEGLARLYQARQIQPVDLFLASSIAFFFLVAALWQRKDFEGLVPAVLALLGVVKIIFLAKRPQEKFSEYEFLLALGIPLLVMFLCMDSGNLRGVITFPKGQDNIEYQTFARNIFANGDYFLLNHPPRAYKVLFPYLVGFEHILFGQSVAAQLFMNAWFAFFSALFLVKIVMAQSASNLKSFLIPFLLVLIFSLPSFFTFYFRFGLIEPMAVCLLLATMLFAQQKRWLAMSFTGMLTVLLRLDYIGLVFGSSILASAPLTGNLKSCMTIFVSWLSQNWKKLIAFGAALVMPPIAITLAYFWLKPGYVLNASDTRHTSLYSVVEGIVRIILGGSIDELIRRFSTNPLDILMITVPLVTGTVLGLLALLRFRRFQKSDMRSGLLMLSLLVIYLIVRPTGYSPRFSTPLLPLVLLAIYDFMSSSAAR